MFFGAYGFDESCPQIFLDIKEPWCAPTFFHSERWGSMKRLHILHIEDNLNDFELIREKMVSEGLDCEIERVYTRNDVLRAIKLGNYDIILCDYKIPSYDGLSALQDVRRVNRDAPFIFVSGTIGDVRAVEALKLGATDYVLKNDLTRLTPAIQRALREKEERVKRQTAEEALAEREQFLRSIIEAEPECVKLIDREGKILKMNKAGLQMVEADSEQQVVGRSVYDFIPPEYRQAFQTLVERSLRGESGTLQFEIIGLRGARRWADTIAVPFWDPKGEVKATLAITRDTTERNRAEKLQHAIYRIAQEAHSSRGLNDTFRAIHAIIKEIMYGENFYIALYDENADIISFPYFVDEFDTPSPPMKPGKGLTEYVLRTGKSLLCEEHTHEELIRRGEAELVGRPSPIWLGVPLTFEKKTIGVMVVQHYSNPHIYGEREKQILEYIASQVGTVIDRKRAEEEIMRQRALFQQLFEGANVGIVLLDVTDTILDVNKTFEKIFQYTKDELKGKKINDVIVLEKLSHEAKEFSQMIRTSQKLEKETERKRKDGTTVDVLINGFPIVINQELVGICAIYVDITERKKLHAQFLRAQRMESIGTLAAGIAHDLNNVLGPIMMSVALLKRKITDPQGQRMLETLETSATRGAELVKQVLMFGRGGVEGERVHVQLRHLVLEIEKILRETFPKSIQLHKNIAKDLWLVSADATQLHQVLMNLCVNARDAMPNGGMLTITAENVLMDEQYARMHIEGKPGPYVLLTVTDTGTGIPPKILEKIFDPFFTTKEIGKGTGLGLSTVSSIVKSHGGFVSVYSEMGRGSVFKVYLLALETAELPKAVQKEIKLPSGNGELILVVDDEASIREITKETLQTVGYRVVEAGDGAEALAVYAENRKEISVVITDMAMPYLDGPTTIRALHKINSAIKIIAVSGRADAQTLDETTRSSVRELLHKPYTAETLLTALQHVLHGGVTGITS